MSDRVKTLCKIRDVYRAISEFEVNFQNKYSICLNEGMLLCTLEDNRYSSSQIAERLGLTNSNASKVIKSLENKNLIKRILGEEDKRQMYFVISDKGQKMLNSIKCDEIEIPDQLQTFMSATST